MESREIKEKRKNKFLDKLKNKNKNKEYKNEIPLINNKTPIPENEELSLHKNIPESNGETMSNIISNNNINNNSNINNNINNNSNDFIKGEQTEKKLDYNQLFKKVNKNEFIKTILNIIKKVLIIVLSIFHYLNYYNLDNIKNFKYTLLIIEITSLLLDLFLSQIIKIKVSKAINKLDEEYKNKKYDLPFEQTFKLLKHSSIDFTFLNYIFKFFNVLMEIFVDIAIIFVIHFIFFIIYEEDD